MFFVDLFWTRPHLASDFFFHLELWRHRQRSSAKVLKNDWRRKPLGHLLIRQWLHASLVPEATTHSSPWQFIGFPCTPELGYWVDLDQRDQPRFHSCRWKLQNFLEILVPFVFLFLFLEGWQRIWKSLIHLVFLGALFSFCLFSVLWCHVTITLLESSDTLRIRRTRVDKGNYIWQFHPPHPCTHHWLRNPCYCIHSQLAGGTWDLLATMIR